MAVWLLEPTWVSTARDSLWVFCVSRTNKLQNLQDVSIGALKRMVAQATHLQISFAAGLRPGWWLWKGEIRRRFLTYLALLTFEMANGSWIRARLYLMWHRFSPSITVFFLNLKVIPLSLAEDFPLMTDAFLVLSVLRCNTGFINVSTEFFPYSSGPDGDKKDFCFKNYLPPFLPWPPPTKVREGLILD